MSAGEQSAESAWLTEADRDALRKAVWPVDPERTDNRHDIHRRVAAEVDRIVGEHLIAFAERERPRVEVGGVPQALRVAAMLDAGVLGDAWDTIQPSIVRTPPWSYLRRFLHALADATEPRTRPEQSATP